MPNINNWLKNSQIWPESERCVLCLESIKGGEDLCQGCLTDLPRIEHSCKICGLALSRNGLCADCLKRPPPFDGVFAAFHYEPPVDYMIQQLKFQRRLYYARILADLMLPELQRALNQGRLALPQCIMPVPLHWRRLWQRSFNQSLEIARHLSRKLKVPLDYRCLKRLNHTAQQAKLTAKQRRRNLQDAFRVSPTGHHHVTLVDDVMTTKQTAWQLAGLLKQQGVKRVDVWVVARVDAQ